MWALYKQTGKEHTGNGTSWTAKLLNCRHRQEKIILSHRRDLQQDHTRERKHSQAKERHTYTDKRSIQSITRQKGSHSI